MKTYSIKKQIRIQKLQNKHRMVGQAFNPSGITSEQIRTRENNFTDKFDKMTKEERRQYWQNTAKVREIWQGSYPWEWCVFIRHYVSGGDVI